MSNWSVFDALRNHMQRDHGIAEGSKFGPLLSAGIWAGTSAAKGRMDDEDLPDAHDQMHKMGFLSHTHTPEELASVRGALKNLPVGRMTWSGMRYDRNQAGDKIEKGQPSPGDVGPPRP